MTQWIRWWGLGFFAVICLGWWLSIDWVVENAIETFGTEAMEAKVELDNAELNLSPLSIVLRGLQVTDPEQPMQNLFVADHIELSLDSLMLLRRKVISEQMIVSGLQFYTPRIRSGAIKALSKATENQQDSGGFSLPGVSLPSTDDLIAKQKGDIQQEIDSIQNNIKVIQNKWGNKQDELPDKAAMNDYKKRFKKLKKGNFLEKITGLKSLRDDIKNDLDVIDDLNNELDKDMASIKRELNRAKTLPERQADKILSSVGITTGSSEFSQALLGGKLQVWLQQALNIFELLSNADTDKENSQPSRGDGTWVAFKEHQPLPDLLLKTIQLSGVITTAGQAINFDGQLLNVTHQPKQWHEPLSFSIKGKSAQGGSLQAKGILDHRNEIGKDTASFSLSQLELSDYLLSNSPKLNLFLKKGLLNSSGNLSLTNQQLNFTSDSSFDNINLEINSTEANKTSRLIASTLSDVSEFKLSLAATGNYDKPKITIKSSLDELLKGALKSQIKAESNKLKGELTQKLKQQLSGKLGELNSEAGTLDEFRTMLDQKKGELDAIKK
jgi:uncharacterized protein (TIGR03545 family)